MFANQLQQFWTVWSLWGAALYVHSWLGLLPCLDAPWWVFTKPEKEAVGEKRRSAALALRSFYLASFCLDGGNGCNLPRHLLLKESGKEGARPPVAREEALPPGSSQTSL